MNVWTKPMLAAVLTTAAALAHAAPVVRLFTLQTDPAQAAAFEAAGVDNMRASVTTEPGVLAMHAARDKAEPARVYVFEAYADDAAYRAHVASPHFKRYLDNAQTLVKGREVVELVPRYLGEQPAPLAFPPAGAAPLVNVARISVKPEYRQAFRQVVMPEMIESLRVEPGVLAIYAGTVQGRPDDWVFFEIYASDAAYQAHRQTPHFQHYLKETPPMLGARQVMGASPIVLMNKGGLDFRAAD